MALSLAGPFGKPLVHVLDVILNFSGTEAMELRTSVVFPHSGKGPQRSVDNSRHLFGGQKWSHRAVWDVICHDTLLFSLHDAVRPIGQNDQDQ